MLRPSTLRRLGGYDLECCIAAGATTHVYRARSPAMPGPVAIKLLSPALSVHPELVARFREEAELSLQLRHPNLPEAYDSGISSGVPFLVMELLDGPTVSELTQRLRDRGSTMSVEAAMTIVRDACRALGYAHHFVDLGGVHRQIIHGDVSPANLVLCRNGNVKLIDFGIARVVGPFDCDVTASGNGRHAYMAPEQLLGEPIDRRVDVYAAGLVLFELLTGKPMFSGPIIGERSEELPRGGAERLARLGERRHSTLELPSRERPELPRLVDGIVRRAMAHDRAQRYPSGSAMARAIDALAGLLYSKRRMSELVRELFTDEERVVKRDQDHDTAPVAVEGVTVAQPDSWDRWETARVNVG
jgi:serine/threonine-protein kinase